MDWDKYSIVKMLPIIQNRYVKTSKTTITGMNSVIRATASTTKYGIDQINPMKVLSK